MKPFYTLIAFASILISSQLNAQTTLAAGDVMIIGWNADKTNTNTGGSWPSGDNDICFLTLTNLTAGTEIFFTDLGWTGSGFQSNGNGSCVASGAQSDGCIKWTAPAGGLTAGTQVRIGCCYGLVASSGTVTGVLSSPSTPLGGPSSSSTGYMSLSIGADEIFAFQSTNSGAPFAGTLTLIAAVHYGNNWSTTVTQCQTISTASNDPGSNVGGYAFLWNTATPDDNAYYSGPTTGNAATLRTNILNTSNWTVTDNVQYVFPIAASFPLPVHLISFQGKSTPSGNRLEWKVENEEHFSHYNIEGSTDAIAFDLLGTVKATGENYYSFTSNATSQVPFYRLKMVDMDGSFTYSAILKLLSKAEKQKLSIYPNPTNDKVTISSSETMIELIVTDARGKQCLLQKGNGMQTAKLDLQGLASGVYVVTVKTIRGQQTQQIVKRKT